MKGFGGGLIGRTARKACNGFPEHLSRICELLVLAGGKAALMILFLQRMFFVLIRQES
jgi:hypothetical protein